MDYFYCPPEKIVHGTVNIEGEEFAHLTHVMRKKVGDEIRVVDGKGTAFDVRLESINMKIAAGTILATHSNHNEPHVSLTIGVGILKNPSKFDFLVEKITELGVKEIIPLRTERTIPSHAKIDRWQKLALAAMKQSGRSFLPCVREMIFLDELINEANPYNLKLIAHEKVEDSSKLKDLISSKTASAIALIGPEGGFTDDEVEACIHSGFKPICFGSRRLRTETAAIVAASMILI